MGRVSLLISSLALSTSAAVQTEERAGGIFGLGLLPFGDDGAGTDGPTADSNDTAGDEDNIGLLESLLTANTNDDSSADSGSDTDIVQTLINVLTGVTSTLPIEDIANLL